MIWIRSYIYLVWLYGSMTIVGVTFAPVAAFSQKAGIAAARTWGAVAVAGLRWICGVTLEIRGREFIPKGAALIASKHQAMLDTLVWFSLVGNPAIVLKEELLKMPIFGWFLNRCHMIAIKREAQASALRLMLRAARAEADRGRPIVIFPEGHRQGPGAPPDYKPGVAALYRDLKLPCAPVALNSGLCWPAHGVKRTPGHVVIEFLPPIPPGLSRDDFMTRLQTTIETASNALLLEKR